MKVVVISIGTLRPSLQAEEATFCLCFTVAWDHTRAARRHAGLGAHPQHSRCDCGALNVRGLADATPPALPPGWLVGSRHRAAHLLA